MPLGAAPGNKQLKERSDTICGCSSFGEVKICPFDVRNLCIFKYTITLSGGEIKLKTI